MDPTEQIAQNFYNQALLLAPNPLVKKVIPEELKSYYLMWNAETVEEIATGTRISEHNWTQKLAKINDFCQKFLNGEIKKSEILVVKDTNHSQMLIIDGIHRSVGFYKAYLIDSSIVSKTDFTYKFFISDIIIEMHDYQRLFG